MKLHATSKLGLLAVLALGAGDIRHRHVAEAAPSSFRGSATAHHRRLACSDNTKPKNCPEACTWTGGRDAKCVDATPPPIEPPAPPPPPPTSPPTQSPTSAPTQSPTAAPAPAPEGAGACSDDATTSCFDVEECACFQQGRRNLQVVCSSYSNKRTCNGAPSVDGAPSCAWNKDSRKCEPAVTTTNAPTGAPNPAPTDLPTGAPNPSPTPPPTPCECVGLSSDAPTDDPSSVPSTKPSGQPSSSPSEAPSKWPSPWPSSQPSSSPSEVPSKWPSPWPSSQPSSNPSEAPSSWPSPWPSSEPSSSPSKWPSPWPSSMPSSAPSPWPSSQPSSKPSPWPSSQPSSKPSPWPSNMPSSKPSPWPSSQPSRNPSPWPSSQPSSAPSGLPTSDPTAHPSSDPTESAVPSSTPSSSAVPSSTPSIRASYRNCDAPVYLGPTPPPSDDPAPCVDTSLGACQERLCVGDNCTFDPDYQESTECACGYCVAECPPGFFDCTANCQHDYDYAGPFPTSLLLAAPCQYENITVSLDTGFCRFNVTRGADGYFNITPPLDGCQEEYSGYALPEVTIDGYGSPPYNETTVTDTNCTPDGTACSSDGSFVIHTSCLSPLYLNMTFGPQQDLRLVGTCFRVGAELNENCAYLDTEDPSQCSNSSAQLF